MNQFVSAEPKTAAFDKKIRTFSLVALILAALNSLTYFAYYDWEYNNGDSFYKLAVEFPKGLNFISFLLNIAPFVLLILYIHKYHKESKAPVILPVIFGIISFSSLYYIFTSVLLYEYKLTLSNLLLTLPIAATFGLATYDGLKGFPNKNILKIAIVVGILTEVLSALNFIEHIDIYIEEGLYLYLFTGIAGIFGTIALYISLLLFTLNNKIPAVISGFYSNTNPEQKLRILKNKFETGMITEEEYQTQRTEIISKL